MKNNIKINKKINKPRSGVIYHYRLNKRNKVKSVVQKEVKIQTQRSRSNKSTIDRQSKLNVKSVSVKSSLIPRKQRNVKSTFDSLPKIKSIQNIGANKILAMFAPGPSILEVEIKRLIGTKNIDTMTINKPDYRFWPTDYWMFCDRTQYNRNKIDFHKFPNTIINTNSIRAHHNKQIKINHLPGKGFSTDMTKGFYIGRSTTFSAMQVAAWMGYEKIFVFGIDMCEVKGKLHSYGQNPDVSRDNRLRRFSKEAEFYDAAANIIKKDIRDKYYFCSSYNPWPFVDKFNRLDQKEAIDFMLSC